MKIMKPFQTLIFLALLFGSTQADAKSLNTQCNLRYNNRGIVYANVPCKAKFHNRRLNAVSLVFPSNKYKYNWTVGVGAITADPRWPECVRHTAKEGNQWQICTVPSPDQLGL